MNPSLTISKTANKPQTLFYFISSFSLMVNFEVRVFSPSVNEYNCLLVVGGNIFLKASFIGLITLANPENAFFKRVY